jgi:phage gp29-like protein
MSQLTLWLNEHESYHFEAPSRSLSRQIASREISEDFYLTAFGYLPNPDDILKKLNKDMKVYRELLTDPHVFACVSQLKRGIQSYSYRIEPQQLTKKKTLKLIETSFRNINNFHFVSFIVDAKLWGYQPLEINWISEGGWWLPGSNKAKNLKAIEAKPPWWFNWAPDNRILFKTKENPFPGISIPDENFLVIQHMSTYERPQGFPLLSLVFWPVSAKKNGAKWWIKFVEKYGMPWPIAKHPRGLGEREISAILDALDKLCQDGVGTVPNDSSIDFHESSGKSSDIYERYEIFWNNEISKALLGQTLTVEMRGAESSSYGAAKTHQEGMNLAELAIKAMAENAGNELIAKINELNFDDPYPPIYCLYRENQYETLLKDTKVIEGWSREKGATQRRFSTQYYLRKYGYNPEDIEEIPRTEKQGIYESQMKLPEDYES